MQNNYKWDGQLGKCVLQTKQNLWLEFNLQCFKNTPFSKCFLTDFEIGISISYLIFQFRRVYLRLIFNFFFKYRILFLMKIIKTAS